MTQATFTDAVRSHIAADRSMLNVSIPAVITSYDPITQKCSCQPLIDSLLRDERLVRMPILEDIPVMFPSTQLSALTFPVNVTDTVLLVFSQRSLDNWLATRDTNPVNPEDFRKHDLSDAIAIPGLFSFPRAINDPSKHTLLHDTDDLVISHNLGSPNENEIRLESNGTIKISAGEGTKITLNLDGTMTIDAPTTLAVTSPTTTWVGDINVTGTVTATTDVVGGGKSLATHVHSGVTTGGSNTGVPV
tara:strand:- start:7709 stop:8449 length:741 start_codon:yes stop_codon:yes gene_type:complete